MRAPRFRLLRFSPADLAAVMGLPCGLVIALVATGGLYVGAELRTELRQHVEARRDECHRTLRIDADGFVCGDVSFDCTCIDDA